MADTSNLSSYLKDLADAIRTKKETTEQIPAANFDTEILGIKTGIDISNCVIVHSLYELNTIDSEFNTALVLNKDDSLHTIAHRDADGVWSDFRKCENTDEDNIYRPSGFSNPVAPIFNEYGYIKYKVTASSSAITFVSNYPKKDEPDIIPTKTLVNLSDLGINLGGTIFHTLATSSDILNPYIVVFATSSSYSTSAKVTIFGYKEENDSIVYTGEYKQIDVTSSGYFSNSTCFAMSKFGKYFAYSTDGINASGGRNNVGYNCIFTVGDDLSITKSTELNSNRQKNHIYFIDNDRVLVQYSQNTSYSSYDSCYYRFTDDMTKSGKLSRNIAMLDNGKYGISADQYGTSITLYNLIIDYENYTITNGASIQTLATGITASSSSSYGCLAVLTNFDKFLYIDGTMSSEQASIKIDMTQAEPLSIDSSHSYTYALDQRSSNTVYPTHVACKIAAGTMMASYMHWTKLLYYVNSELKSVDLTIADFTASNLLRSITVTEREPSRWGRVPYLDITGNAYNTGIIYRDNEYTVSVNGDEVAFAIGLTADKIVNGNTILGIEGTYESAISQTEYDECLELSEQILGENVSL